MKRFLSVFLTVMMVFSVGAAALAQLNTELDSGKLTGDAKLYPEADGDSKSLVSIAKGKTVVVIDHEDGFYMVAYGNYCGYIQEKYLDGVDVMESAQGGINASTKLYKTASTKKGHVVTLKKGEVVTIIGETESYYRVAVNNKAGYVLKKYVELAAPAGLDEYYDQLKADEPSGAVADALVDFQKLCDESDCSTLSTYYIEEINTIYLVYKYPITREILQLRVYTDIDEKLSWEENLENDKLLALDCMSYLKAEGMYSIRVKVCAIDAEGEILSIVTDGTLTTCSIDSDYKIDEDLTAAVDRAGELVSEVGFEGKFNYRTNSYIICWYSDDIAVSDIKYYYNNDWQFRLYWRSITSVTNDLTLTCKELFDACGYKNVDVVYYGFDKNGDVFAVSENGETVQNAAC